MVRHFYERLARSSRALALCKLAAYVLCNDWVCKLGSGIAAGNSDNTSTASAGGRGRWGGRRG